jgi:hypothetical protein
VPTIGQQVEHISNTERFGQHEGVGRLHEVLYRRLAALLLSYQNNERYLCVVLPHQLSHAKTLGPMNVQRDKSEVRRGTMETGKPLSGVLIVLEEHELMLVSLKIRREDGS